jgi:hypothetical protein
LGVVDQAQQRLLGPDLGQQAQRGEGDEEAVGSRTEGQAERDAEGGLLRLGKLREAAEQRRAELVQCRERQLHLGLDSGDAGDPEPRRLPSAVLQDGRLADAGLAANDEDRALASPDILQQPIEHLTLVGSAEQDRGTLGGHWPLA